MQVHCIAAVHDRDRTHAVRVGMGCSLRCLNVECHMWQGDGGAVHASDVSRVMGGQGLSPFFHSASNKGKRQLLRKLFYWVR